MGAKTTASVIPIGVVLLHKLTAAARSFSDTIRAIKAGPATKIEAQPRPSKTREHNKISTLPEKDPMTLASGRIISETVITRPVPIRSAKSPTAIPMIVPRALKIETTQPAVTRSISNSDRINGSAGGTFPIQKAVLIPMQIIIIIWCHWVRVAVIFYITANSSFIRRKLKI